MNTSKQADTFADFFEALADESVNITVDATFYQTVFGEFDFSVESERTLLQIIGKIIFRVAEGKTLESDKRLRALVLLLRNKFGVQRLQLKTLMLGLAKKHTLEKV